MDSQAKTSVNELVDHLFRHNSGQMVSVLTRIFGFENIDLVEDAIQESLIKALKQWQFKGIPKNPNAWMIQVAKNHIIDHFRKNSKFEKNGDEILNTLEISSNENIETKLAYPNELNEDILCMMFAICHPKLKPDAQIALTLKTVGGFSLDEISRSFLGKKDATAKMLTRAKKTLQRNQVKLNIPVPNQLQPRLNAVLKVLYLMFNEGYSSSINNKLIREDLCFEAIRLAQILANHPVTASPKIEALLALFFFQTARFETRHNQSNDFLPLAEQNRELWDKKLINLGLRHLKKSAKGFEVSNYHLEAEIASCHIFADNYDSTDWKHILDCYDKLLKIKFSPVVALNRIIVLSKVEGANAALRELKNFQKISKLKNYFPFYVASAQVQLENKMFNKAKNSYEKAITIAENTSIINFLNKKITALGKQLDR